MNKKGHQLNHNKNFLVKYSFVFAICCATTFLWYWLNGRTFIWYYDGYGQHYKALTYYGSYLREVIHCIFTGRFGSIPSWSLFIGEGGDILQTMHYYAIGDPLTVFSVFFNSSNMYILYDVLGIVRLYLSGLTFIYFFKVVKVKTKNDTPIVMGGISYAFCLWAIYNTARHPFFVNPMIYLPLILAGVEKVIRRERSLLLVLSVCVAALSNFYFFYMLVLITVVYVVVRMICLYGRKYKEYICPLVRISLASICGLLMACIIFIPVAYAFLSDSRAGFSSAFNLVYGMDYYAKLPAMLLSPTMEYWVCLSWCIPAFFGLILLFRIKKANREIKVLLGISLLFLLIPLVGQIFNAMSYMTNRWCFAIALLVAFVVSIMWDKLVDVDSAFWRSCALISVIMLVICLVIQQSRMPRTITMCIMLLVSSMVLYYLNKKGYRKATGVFMTILVVVSVTNTSFWLNSYGGDNYASECRRPSEISEYESVNELSAIDAVNNKDYFYRYTGKNILRNAGLNNQKSSIMYNWTLSNPNVAAFNTDLEMMKYEMNEYENYDDRTIPMTFSSVLYDAIPNEYGFIPFGYEPVYEYNNNTLYENKNPLSLTYSYDSIISSEVWGKMDSIDKQESLLYGVVLDGYTDNAMSIMNDSCLKNVRSTYDITCVNFGGVIDSDNHRIEVNDGGAIFELTFDGVSNAENYVVFHGITYLDGTDAPIIIASPVGDKKTLTLYEDGYEYYNGRHDFVVNLGYSSDEITRIVIAFTTAGEYAFDSIEIAHQPMDEYVNCIESVSENTVDNIDIQTDRITGNIELNQTKAVVWAIPYSEGWNATVDGTETAIYRANDKYMALVIPAGQHSIVLEYNTPMFDIGCILSLIGILMFIGITVYEGVANKRK